MIPGEDHGNRSWEFYYENVPLSPTTIGPSPSPTRRVPRELPPGKTFRVVRPRFHQDFVPGTLPTPPPEISQPLPVVLPPTRWCTETPPAFRASPLPTFGGSPIRRDAPSLRPRPPPRCVPDPSASRPIPRSGG